MQTFGIVDNGRVRDMTEEEIQLLSEMEEKNDNDFTKGKDTTFNLLP